MQDTPIFYQKSHELGAFLARALEEKDSAGKRATLQSAWRLLKSYQLGIEEYLKTPPATEPETRSPWPLPRRRGWIQRDLAARDALKEEIRRALRESYTPV